jgi:two-component system, LytTR family, sensor kinase
MRKYFSEAISKIRLSSRTLIRDLEEVFLNGIPAQGRNDRLLVGGFLRWLLLILVCTFSGIAFFLYIYYSERGTVPSLTAQGKNYLLAIAATNMIGLLVLKIDGLLDKAIHWKNHFFLRFLTGFVINMFVSIGIMMGSIHLFSKIDVEEVLKLGILFTISVFIYEIFYGWFYSYRYYAHTQVEQLRSDRWQLELQFESLKNQISPHYLFNCLNTISSLLYKDSQMAEDFIRRMADTFRYVLSNQKQKLVTLRQEVEFVKAYCYLMQVRYEDHLRLEINLPKNILDTSVPPLTLQMLVENAVKHNQISKENPLLVYISARDNTHLVITSTKTVAAPASTSFRIGLDNIRNRYRFFTDKQVVVKDEDKFTVQLPVIKTIPLNGTPHASVNTNTLTAGAL